MQEKEFIELVKSYYKTNTSLAKMKKTVEDKNKQIKNYLNDKKIYSMDIDDISVSLNCTETTSTDSDVLLAIVKELNRPDLIKTLEVVDTSALETALYKEEIDAKSLLPAQTVQTKQTLYVKQKKKATK